MRVCVIGGTGHIGQHLTPMLVEAGHEVTVISSGRTPVPEGGAWDAVVAVRLGYGADGWTDTIRELRPEALIDILQGRSPELYEALRGVCAHFTVCGSLWMLGRPRVVPTPAAASRAPSSDLCAGRTTCARSSTVMRDPVGSPAASSRATSSTNASGSKATPAAITQRVRSRSAATGSM